MRALKKTVYRTILFINDISAVYFSFRFSYEIRFFLKPFLNIFPASKGTPEWTIYSNALKIILPLWILVILSAGKLYRKPPLDAANEFLEVTKSALFATLLTLSATFLYREYEYSRLMLALSFILSIVSLFSGREIIKLLYGFILSKASRQELVITIGNGKSMKAAIQLLQKDPHKALLTYSDSELDKVKKFIEQKDFDGELLISGKLIDREDLQELIDTCEEKKIEVKILPDLLEMRLGEINVDNSLGMPIFHLKALSLHRSNYLVKRIFDILFSLSILTLLFIPLLLISILIILDSKGGVFFRQERVGFKEKRFRCLKFRTMHVNAEKLLKELNLQSFRGGPAFKMRGDPRITRAGKILRRFSCDEIPQIWNVLKGEMSLIGPRPQVLKEAEGNPKWAKKRFRVKPGITGLWQVSGRADLSYEDMMRLDIFYLENWSPGLDLRILLKTIPVMLIGRGAY